jgi:hypothetical protein
VSTTISRRKPLELLNENIPAQKDKSVMRPGNEGKYDDTQMISPQSISIDVHELSSVSEKKSLKKISLRILDGLQGDAPFCELACSFNLKSELRKLLKHSNPHIFKEIENCQSSVKQVNLSATSSALLSSISSNPVHPPDFLSATTMTTCDSFIKLDSYTV